MSGHLPASERATLQSLACGVRHLHWTVVREIDMGRGPAILIDQGLADFDGKALWITDKGRKALQEDSVSDPNALPF